MFISGNSATGNRILSNSIFSNGLLGIDLNDDDVTPNDTGDADSGSSDLQNFPVVTSATATTIKGTLNSTPNQTFTLQFFSSPTPDPSGFGEGKKFIGSKSVSTNSNGNISFTFNPPKEVTAGQRITATATDPEGNISEFSKARKVMAQLHERSVHENRAGPRGLAPPRQEQRKHDRNEDGAARGEGQDASVGLVGGGAHGRLRAARS